MEAMTQEQILASIKKAREEMAGRGYGHTHNHLWANSGDFATAYPDVKLGPMQDTVEIDGLICHISSFWPRGSVYLVTEEVSRQARKSLRDYSQLQPKNTQP